MFSLSFLFWALLSFGAYILWIGLILVVEGIGGSLLYFLPLFLMPLFALLFSFFTSKHLCKKGCKAVEIFLSQFSGLFLAGLLHFVATLALKGFRMDLLTLFFDLFVVMSLGLGVFFGIRVQRLLDENKKRRSRFDD